MTATETTHLAAEGRAAGVTPKRLQSLHARRRRHLLCVASMIALQVSMAAADQACDRDLEHVRALGLSLDCVARERLALNDNAPSSEPYPVPARNTTAYIGEPPKQRALPPLPGDPESRALIGRVKSRWAALVGGDLEQAASYIPPSVRNSGEREGGVSGSGPYIRWHGAEVVRLEIDAGESARVGVLVDHSFIAPTGGDDPIRTKSFAWERWVKEDGNWWHQTETATIPGLQPARRDRPAQ